MEWLRYDRRQVSDTGRYIGLEKLGVDHPDREDYQPTRWSTLRALLPRSAVRPDDVFVDFGSGLGRVVQSAAAYPFARVIGVEISEELNQTARQNFERNRDRLICQQAEFVTCDAVDFPVPDDMTYAFFFNPFTGETFRRVLQNIVASIDRNPRRVVLFYHLPEMKEAIEESGQFRLVEAKKTARTVTTHIYESIPASDGRDDAPSTHPPVIRRAPRSSGFRRPAGAGRPKGRVRALLRAHIAIRLRRFLDRANAWFVALGGAAPEFWV